MNANRLILRQCLAILLSFGFNFAAVAPACFAQLQGGVEQAEVMQPVPMAVPNLKRKPLQGTDTQNASPGTPAMQDPLAGVAGNDPDANDQELQIQWDLWRNTLMNAIQNGTLAKINVQNDVHFVLDPAKQMMVSRYPNGTSAWYAIDVLPNRKITNVRLTQRTRYPSYDQAVLQAINDLQGSSILTYPAGSKRQLVSQEASVKTAGESSSTDVKFGDVEKQRY
jgi:hypothetical protein